MSTWTAFWFLFFVGIVCKFGWFNDRQFKEIIEALRAGYGAKKLACCMLGFVLANIVGAIGACHFGIQLWEQAHA